MYIHKQSWSRRSMFVRDEDCWKDLLLRAHYCKYMSHEQNMRSDVHVSEDVLLYMTASLCVLHVVQAEVEEEVTVGMSDVNGLIILLMMWLEELVKTWMKTERHLSVYARKASHVWGGIK